MRSLATFKIAHIREQGIDLIIVPMNRAFGNLPASDQQTSTAELQAQCLAAKLAGTVVPVWDCGDGKMSFAAPQSWHPFFLSIDLRWVSDRLNRELHFCTGDAGERLAVALGLPQGLRRAG